MVELTATQALHRGVAAYKAGNLLEAERFYRAILKSQPERPGLHHDVTVIAQAYCNLGVALQQQGDLKAAIDSYRQAVAIKPDYTEVYYTMGLALRDKGDLRASIECYQQAVEIKPNDVDAYNNMGHALHDKGELKSAIDCYNKALKIIPDSAQTHNNLGNALRKAGEYAEAIEHFDSITAIELNPSNPQYWFNSKAQALECLYISGRYAELEERLAVLANSTDTNLRVAAVSAYVSHQLKFDDPYPFCKRPLDYLHVGKLSDHSTEVSSFVENIILEAKQEKAVWEPLHGVTKGGFQTSNTIFKAGQNCSALESILREEIEAYRANFGPADCEYLESWPNEYELRGWFSRLIKNGYQTPHNHPSGWLSGVIYLKTIDSPDSDDGAIELGLRGHDLPILDNDYARKIHRPKVGDIILFPSSLFHRTIPFSEDTERCVIAFDLYRH